MYLVNINMLLTMDTRIYVLTGTLKISSRRIYQNTKKNVFRCDMNFDDFR